MLKDNIKGYYENEFSKIKPQVVRYWKYKDSHNETILDSPRHEIKGELNPKTIFLQNIFYRPHFTLNVKIKLGRTFPLIYTFLNTFSQILSKMSYF